MGQKGEIAPVRIDLEAGVFGLLVRGLFCQDWTAFFIVLRAALTLNPALRKDEKIKIFFLVNKLMTL